MSQNIIREETDIYPHRLPVANGTCLVIEIDAALDVVHTAHTYDPQIPGHSVRVPVTMYIRPVPATGPAYRHFWRNQMRREANSHLLINPTIQVAPFRSSLVVIKTYWAGIVRETDLEKLTLQHDLEYTTKNPCAQSYVLPTFKPGAAGVPQMLLGVCFPRSQYPIEYTRTYTRLDYEETTEYAVDITQDFIQPDIGGNLHFQNQMLFANHISTEENNIEQSSIAFYVCRGAKLMVKDERSSTQHLGKPGHCRGLYQAGSLVICTGTMRIAFDVTQNDRQKFRNQPWSNLFDYCLRPQQTAQRVLDNWERNTAGDPGLTLNDYQNKVIFLGAIESQFSSACWELSVDNPPNISDDRYCYSYLTIPPNGIIEDIAPWNTGFRLIWARFQYEQAWRDVLRFPDTTPVQPFTVPNEYLIRRMLGVTADQSEQWGPMAINYPFERLDIPATPEIATNQDIRRHIVQYSDFLNMVALRNIERPIQWHLSEWHDKMPPPPPPHLPPIEIFDNRYFYLTKYDRLRLIAANNQIGFFTESAEGMYELNYKLNAPGYLWVRSTPETQDILFQWLDANVQPDDCFMQEWFRWSVDGVEYLKWPALSDYNIKTMYLKRLPNT